MMVGSGRSADRVSGGCDVSGPIVATETQAGGINVSLTDFGITRPAESRCLVISTTAVAVGLLAGVVMNLNRWGHVVWTDRGVLLSMLLLLWLVAATALEYFYEPASRGRKAVYLTLASLGFLILAMIGVLSSSHGQAAETSGRQVPARWSHLSLWERSKEEPGVRRQATGKRRR